MQPPTDTWLKACPLVAQLHRAQPAIIPNNNNNNNNYNNNNLSSFDIQADPLFSLCGSPEFH